MQISVSSATQANLEAIIFAKVWESIDTLLPHMQFHIHHGDSGDSWVSSYHLNGKQDSQGSTTTYVYRNAPHLAFEHGRGIPPKRLLSLIIEQVESVKSPADALAYIAKETGEILPEMPEEWKALQERTRRLEEAEKAFYDALLYDPSEQAQAVRDYIVSRRWTPSDIKASGIGYISEEAAQAIGAPSGHPLAIPVRQGDAIVGFKFRNIVGKRDYISLKGTRKSGALFGIPFRVQSGRVAIVESELDAVLASVRNMPFGEKHPLTTMPPVVATSGSAVSPSQAADAVTRGARTFILLMDNDEGGQSFIEPSASTIAKAGGQTFVATIPRQYKDLGDLFADGASIADIATIIEDAVEFGVWKVHTYLAAHPSLPKSGSVERSEQVREVVRLIDGAPPYERVPLIDRTASTWHIDPSEIVTNIEQMRQQADAAKAQKLSADALREAATLIEAGDDRNAQKALQKAREASASSKVFDIINSVDTWESIDAETPDIEPIRTCYTLIDLNRRCRQPLVLPAAGITLIGARSGHGKTRFLLNIVAGMLSDLSSGECVAYFTAESSRREIRGRLLSTLTARMGNDPARAEEQLRAWLSSGTLRIISESNTENVCTIARGIVERKPVRAIFIDHIGILRPNAKHANTKKERMEANCFAIETLATETGKAIVVAAQLNRQEATDPVNMNENSIGDAIEIEQASSVIYLLWDSARDAGTDKQNQGIENALASRGIHMNIGQHGQLLVKCAKSRIPTLSYKAHNVLTIGEGGAIYDR